MRLTDLKEGVPKTLGIGVEIEIHQEKMKELYSSTQSILKVRKAKSFNFIPMAPVPIAHNSYRDGTL